jgi:hypothetical protein
MWFTGEQAELQVRRERLRLRSAELRLHVAADAAVLVAPLALADQTRATLRWLLQHPQVPLLALGLMVVARPRRALRWAGRLWWGWGLWQRGQRWLVAHQRQGI